MAMNITPNTLVEFYIENDPIPKTGIINAVDRDQVLIKVQHGELHGESVVVNISDIVDDSFDKYDTLDQKLYAWYDGE
jgi:hypothetical protein